MFRKLKVIHHQTGAGNTDPAPVNSTAQSASRQHAGHPTFTKPVS
jgi:hypothetical protein